MQRTADVPAGGSWPARLVVRPARGEVSEGAIKVWARARARLAAGARAIPEPQSTAIGRWRPRWPVATHASWGLGRCARLIRAPPCAPEQSASSRTAQRRPAVGAASSDDGCRRLEGDRGGGSSVCTVCACESRWRTGRDPQAVRLASGQRRFPRRTPPSPMPSALARARGERRRPPRGVGHADGWRHGPRGGDAQRAIPNRFSSESNSCSGAFLGNRGRGRRATDDGRARGAARRPRHARCVPGHGHAPRARAPRALCRGPGCRNPASTLSATRCARHSAARIGC